MAAATTPKVATSAHQRWTRNVPSNTKYSLTKPLRPGRPIEASITMVKMAAITGAGPWRPVSSAIFEVPRRATNHPMSRKKAAVMIPWLSISSTAPVRAWGVNANVPSTMKPT